MRYLGFSLIFLTLAATPARAEADLAAALLACGDKGEDAARLACVDALIAGLRADPEAYGSALVMKPETAAAEFGKPDTKVENPLEELSVAIKLITKDGAGFYVFILENGQVWRASDGKLSVLPNSVRVEIKKGFFGSYMLRAIDEKGRKGRPGKAVRIS